ncbi:MAG: hypothetical protein WAW90_02905 [Minisyncoccia bacterium]
MGQNFFGIEEVIRHFGVVPSGDQTVALTSVPLSEWVLRSVINTHILVAVFPISILRMREVFKKNRLFRNQNWYNDLFFAKDYGIVGWHLVRKTPVPDSKEKSLGAQLKLLENGRRVPSARVMVYTIIGHFMATSRPLFMVSGDRLFEDVGVRCIDLDSEGDRICTTVGFFNEKDGFVANHFGEDVSEEEICLAEECVADISLT